ncbi:MAG: hypothetical protein HY810_01430 [Candidatus Omnitrophica bacterium]|nr:hypothetical protein [Candidatus Omnitrophota bacterium]
MTIKEKENVKILLNYLWKDEQLHYQSARSKNHIFVVLKRLAKSIKCKNQ